MRKRHFKGDERLILTLQTRLFMVKIWKGDTTQEKVGPQSHMRSGSCGSVDPWNLLYPRVLCVFAIKTPQAAMVNSECLFFF